MKVKLGREEKGLGVIRFAVGMTEYAIRVHDGGSLDVLIDHLACLQRELETAECKICGQCGWYGRLHKEVGGVCLLEDCDYTGGLREQGDYIKLQRIRESTPMCEHYEGR